MHEKRRGGGKWRQKTDNCKVTEHIDFRRVNVFIAQIAVKLTVVGGKTKSDEVIGFFFVPHST